MNITYVVTIEKTVVVEAAGGRCVVATVVVEGCIYLYGLAGGKIEGCNYGIVFVLEVFGEEQVVIHEQRTAVEGRHVADVSQKEGLVALVAG